MFKFYTFFLLLCSLCAHSLEFKYVNQFLDAYALTASDGRHALDELNDINLWAGNSEVSHYLESSMFALSAVQVLRGTKAVSFLTPQVFYNNSLFDLSKLP